MTDGSSLSDRVSRWLFDHTRWVAAFLVLLVVVALSALPRLSTEVGVDPFLDRSLPDYRLYEEVKEHFVSDETVLLAYEVSDPFTTRNLEAVRALGDELLKLRLGPDAYAPVHKIDSLATQKDLVGSDMSFRSEPLVPDPVPTDEAELKRIRERALKNPLIREHLVFQNATMSVILVRLAPDLKDAHTRPVVDAVRAAAEVAGRRAGWTTYYLSGKRVVVDETSKAVSRDTRRFVPAALGVMVLVLLLSLRRLAGALLIFFTMVVSLIVGVATMPLLNIPATYMTSVLYPLIMMLACAEGIHYLSELGQQSAPNHLVAAERTLSELLVPASMCSFTTVVGFAAVGVSSIPGLRDFAIISSVIVVVVFVVSFLTLALASRLRPASFWMRPDTLSQSPAYERFVDGYVGLISKYPKALVALSLIVVGASATGIPRLVIDSNALHDLGNRDVPIRAATEAIEEKVAGIESLVVSVKADRDDAFIEPEALKKLDALEAYLREQESMTQVASITGFVKLMHSGFFSEDPKEFRVPDTKEAVAQLLLLNGDRKVDEFLDPARKWARLSGRYKEHSALKQMEIFDRVQRRARELFPAAQGFQADVTGDSKTRVMANSQVVKSQTTGLGLAFLVILFGPIFLVLRSIRGGLLSIPSNLFPIIMVLGTMGWLNVHITPQNTIMASITLGIVVDDTIHFLQHLAQHTAAGEDIAHAVEKTLRAKLAAVWVSTAVFTLGFGVLVVSEFPPVVLFGLLTAGSMLLGLLCELLVLPPLILATRPRLAPSIAKANTAAEPGA